MPRKKRQSSAERRKKITESKRKARENEEYRENERDNQRLTKKKRRMDEDFRNQEREHDRITRQQRRLNEDLRSQERERDRDATQQRRLNEDIRSQERERDRCATQQRRLNEDLRSQERERDRDATQQRRLNEDHRSQEREQNRTAMQQRRLDDDLRSQEREHDRVTRQQRRLNEDHRSKDREQNRTAMQQRRLDDDLRSQEREHDRVTRQQRRLNEDLRSQEREQNRTAMQQRRLDDDLRSREREHDRITRQQRRLNEDIRSQERERDRAARHEVRETPTRIEERNRDRESRARTRGDPVRRRLELDAANIRRNKTDWEKLLHEFRREIRKSPVHPCTSCGCIYYIDMINKINETDIPSEILERVMCVHVDSPQFCDTCKRYIVKGKVPPLCLSNGLAFPEVPNSLQEMTALEERLVALRIVFMHIKAVGSEQQLKLKGNIVNLENDLDTCAKAIPRRFDEMATVQLRFKRRLRDERHVWFEVIRPAVVERAKAFLLQQELYVENNVESRDDFIGYDDDSRLEFVVPDLNQEGTEESNDQHTRAENGKENEWEDISDNVGADETLIYSNLGSNYVDIAPGEGKIPKPLYDDPFAEEMAHPKIYCGQKRKIKKEVKLTYTDIAKSECLREDRRCAAPAKVLYAFKKSFNEKMRNAVQIYLRKRRGKGKITAKQAQNKEFVKSLVNHDEGYSVWKNLRSSPSYWAQRSKQVISMIRQLGKCAFFITFSAAETKWNELLVTLKKLLKNESISEEEAAALSSHEKAEMIRSDPITCMRHFDRRIRKAHTLLMKRENGIFAPYKLKDDFRRIEYQMRGSPHSHGLYWIDKAPEYDENDPTSVVRCREFIDNFITVEKCQEGPMEQLLKMQTHSHSSTCKYKEGKRDCRFGYPLPPMPETTILEPLPKDTSKASRKRHLTTYKTIQEELTGRTKNNDTDIGFDEFLTILGVTKENYVMAIRSSIKRTTVFHKRQVNAAFINRYNRKMLEAWGANMDIQFVTNTYACAKYCVGYILKSDGGISKLMKAANREAKGNADIREKLKSCCKVLLNGTEISAQEGAGFLLGIPNTHSSRQGTFVNTGPPEERTGILKSSAELKALEDDSEDICEKGLLDRYTNRSEQLEDTCLAEFASHYEFEKKSSSRQISEQERLTEDIEDEMDDVMPRKMPRFPQLDNSGYMRKRTVRKVIRFRNYSRKVDPINYFREQLMLFIPWRDEELELLNVDTKEFGLLFWDEIVQNSSPFYKNRKVGDEELQALAYEAEEEVDSDQHHHDNVQWEEDEDFLADAMVDPIPTKSRPESSKVEKFLPPNMIPDPDYLRLMRSLNQKQQRIVLDLLHRLKTSDQQFCTFISGGAGVGKSHAITAIVQSTLRYFNSQPGRDLTQPPVIVMAFTGKAAFNVLGMTIHHTLRLLPNQRKYERLPDLDASTLNSLRKKLGGLRLLIIDEISMVSVRMLFDIDQRLRQITGLDAPFGGIIIVVVGHLRQLAPIAAPYVFDVPAHLPNGAAVGNFLWTDNFSYYELCEIMRQRGEAEFCKALNNMSEGQMDGEDIALIKTRQTSVTLVPPDEAVWLFKTNAECIAHNNIVHQKLATEGALSTASDYVQGSGNDQAKSSLLEAAKTWSASECDGLRYETFLKVGGEYFISTNIDVADGLFNGATGTLKAIEYSKPSAEHSEGQPVRVWLDFKSPVIGSIKKRAAAGLINRRIQQNHNYRNWVPVERIKKTLTKSYVYEGLQLIRMQIPLVACNGMTVAKSQGSTMPLVVVSTRGTGRRRLTRQELYVACSRATGIHGLFIDGEFVPPDAPADDDLVTIELARIRQKPYLFKLSFLQDISGDYHKLFFHNVQSLNSHLEDAAADPCVKSADIIAFVEPHLLERDNLKFPGYTVLHRTNCRELRRKRRLVMRNSEGAVLLLKDGTPSTSAVCFRLVDTDASGNGHSIFVTVIYGGLTIVVMYKSPMFQKSRFRQMLHSSLSLVNTNVIYVGDINLDMSDEKNSDIVEVFAKYGLQSRLNLKEVYKRKYSH